MKKISDVFQKVHARPETQDGVFSEDEVRLANRNSGILLDFIVIHVNILVIKLELYILI